MKILLSAYACEPNKGSEPGVGWNWALEIENRGHEVHVLTRANNQSKISKYWEQNTKPKNLHFIYYDVPYWLSWWKKGSRGVYFYYLFWQIGAYFKAKETHKETRFNLVHHITFVTVRQPSFMGLLGIPFIFGPVGGGESTPYSLRKMFGLKGWLKDFVRDIANFLVKFDPLMHLTFSSSKFIQVTSIQTMSLIPKIYREKVRVQLAIGISEQESHLDEKVNKTRSGEIKILFVGRFEYWKGMALGIRAFARLLEKHPKASLTLVGRGPDKKAWQTLVQQLQIESNVTWIDWVNQKELKDLYRENHIFLFPSLHDSGGMVVIEAMANRLPVICLDLGGPSIIVDSSSGIVVSVKNTSQTGAEDGVLQALKVLTVDHDLREKLSKNSLTRASQLSWSKNVELIYSRVESVLESKGSR